MIRYLRADDVWVDTDSFWTLDRLWPILAPCGWATIEEVT